MRVHKYLNPYKYARYALGFANRNLLQSVESLLAPKLDQPLSHPPIFFLGAPRSGSTLAIQVITDVLDVGYMSNRHCQWFGAPAFADRLFHPTSHRPPSDYQSQQGETSGYFAPAECGQWWYRFFRRNPPYMTLSEVDPKLMRMFRGSVAALTVAIYRPILFKNLYASLRIQAIAHYLPESLFIVIHRNEVDNGHSILEERYKRFHDYSPWFSVEPPNVEELKSLPAHKQVIEQIRHIHKTIDEDLRISDVAEKRRFDLVYEEFCANPDDVISKLQVFLKANGCMVSRRGGAPKKFTTRQEVRIDPAIYEQMVAYSSSVGYEQPS